MLTVLGVHFAGRRKSLQKIAKDSRSSLMLCALRFFVVYLTAATALPCVVGGAELRAGIAVVDITPPVPFRMSGYFMERLSTGTKDSLHAKAIVLEQGNESA